MQWLLFVLLTLLVGCDAKRPDGAGNLTRYWELPEFELLSERGVPFSLEEMRGKVWIVDFFYSSCPGPCPMLSSRLSGLHKKLAAHPGIGFLSISCDPSKDTPEVLASYSRKFSADERWRFLTGNREAVLKLAREGFKVSIEEVQGAEDTILHSTKLFLVDRTGWVRGLYDGLEAEKKDEILVRDAVRLSNE